MSFTQVFTEGLLEPYVPPVKDTWADLLLGEELGDDLFELLNAQDLVTMRGVCQGIKALVDHYMATHFTLGRVLDKYFDNIPAFRSVQAKTATLISGSTALQFFGRITYAESDLDLYAWKKHLPILVDYILEEGYKFQSSIRGLNKWTDVLKAWDRGLIQKDGYMGLPLFCTLHFTRARYQKRTTVQIIVALQNPMECILNFHSSEWHISSRTWTQY